MTYLIFQGAVSEYYYYQKFGNIREAETFKQCLQAYVKCGYGRYKNMRIKRSLPKIEYAGFHYRDNVYELCNNVITKFKGYL